MRYGYARVSSTAQDLELQKRELFEAGCNFIFAEKFTGMVKDRPEWSRLMGLIKPGDALVVCKLDRIARSCKNGIEVIDELLSKGVSIEILNMGKFDNSASGKLLRTIMFAFAEFERDMIVERTTEGYEIARITRGVRRGRKRISNELLDKIRSSERWTPEIGVSRSIWYKYRKAAHTHTEAHTEARIV